jgi:hypothetical protein
VFDASQASGARIVLRLQHGLKGQTMQPLSNVSPPLKAPPQQDHEREVLKLAIRSLLLVWCQTRTPGARPERSPLH